MFADNTTLYASHRNVSYLNYILQKDLINLENWFAANSLSLNASKTFAMKFWQDSSMCKEKINLMLNLTMIPIVAHTKFLGVTIDSKLKWSEHINNIISKISINKNILGRAQNLLSTHAKKCIYYAHIYSHIAYANTIWGNFVTSKKKKYRNYPKILY